MRGSGSAPRIAARPAPRPPSGSARPPATGRRPRAVLTDRPRWRPPARPASYHDQPAALDDDRDVTVPIGSLDPRAECLQPRQHGLRRVSVRVIGSDRHESHSGVSGGEKARILKGRPVMRNLENVCSQIRATLKQGPLRSDLGIAREQDRPASDTDPKHDGAVVGIRAGAAERDSGTDHEQP